MKAFGKSLENFVLKRISHCSPKSATSEMQWTFFLGRTSTRAKPNVPSNCYFMKQNSPSGIVNALDEYHDNCG